jgi:hypothetical protein
MDHSRERVSSLHEVFRNEYEVFWVESADEGWAGYELHQRRVEPSTCVCRVIYWDAVGQYFVELPNGELKAEYVLKLLVETSKRTNVSVFGCEHLLKI